jgi:hypothetical protein
MKTTTRTLWGYTNRNATVWTREEAEALARRSRDAEYGRRMPGREGRTRLRIDMRGNPALHYCRTDVVTWLPRGIIKLNTDGHHTKTSKARIEEYAGVCLSGGIGQWWILDRKGRIHKYKDSMRLKHYKDGVAVLGAGSRAVRGLSRDAYDALVRAYNRQLAAHRRERKRREAKWKAEDMIRQQQRATGLEAALDGPDAFPFVATPARATLFLVKGQGKP